MKIHPLFDDLIGVMFTGRTEVGETCYYRTLKDWQAAGKPATEEKPNYSGIPEMGKDGTAYREPGGMWIVFDAVNGIPTKFVGHDPASAIRHGLLERENTRLREELFKAREEREAMMEAVNVRSLVEDVSKKVADEIRPKIEAEKTALRNTTLDEAAREVFPLDVYDKSDPVYKALAGARDRVLGLKK